MRRTIALLISAAAAAAVGATPASAQVTAPPQQCPVVVENTTLKTDCTGPMVIANDRVNVNLAGHQVLCASRAHTGILMVNRTDVHITNGHVHNCGFGIDVQRGGSNTLNNLHIDANTTGVRLLQSDGNQLRELDLLDNRGIGLLLGTSNDNLVQNVTANRNSTGIYLSRASSAAGVPGSGANKVIRAQTHDNVVDGLVLDFQSDGNTIHGSRSSGNGRTGLYLWGSNNEVDGNVFSGTRGTQPLRPANGTGMLVLVPSQNNKIVGNRSTGNAKDGIEVQGQNNLLRANTADGNAEDGITAGATPESPIGTGNTFQANDAEGNGVWDLADYPPGACNVNVWLSNHGVKLYNGCENG